MTPLQQKEYQLLGLFLDICRQLDLRYYLVCGSALGAVKYKGFIPWDDDVDIAMPRGDYQRFLSQAQALLPEGFFLQNFHTDPAFPQIYSKLRDSNTAFIEKKLRPPANSPRDLSGYFSLGRISADIVTSMAIGMEEAVVSTTAGRGLCRTEGMEIQDPVPDHAFAGGTQTDGADRGLL